ISYAWRGPSNSDSAHRRPAKVITQRHKLPKPAQSSLPQLRADRRIRRALRGQACGTSARAEWSVLGNRGAVLLEAAGAVVVALAARRSWFCYHQLFAVLSRFGRRRTGLADLAALGRAFSWTRVCGC